LLIASIRKAEAREEERVPQSKNVPFVTCF
jgi:hypothetical protein